jgi:hypothetical protein
MRKKHVSTLYETKCLMSKIDPTYKLYCGKITKKEMKILRLDEKRHVPTVPYNGIIMEIFNYVENEIVNGNIPYKDVILTAKDNIYKSRKYTIQIPSDVIQNLGELSNIKITIDVTRVFVDDVNDEIITLIKQTISSGGTNVEKASLTDDGKLKNSDMFVKGYMINDTLMSQPLKNTLHHELTHAFDEYISLSKFKSGNDVYNQLLDMGYFNIIQMCKSQDEVTKKFANLLYRFYVPTEMNASLSQLYSEMQQFSPDRNKIWDYLRRTNVWKRYEEGREFFNWLKSFDDWDKWEEWMEGIGIGEMTPQEFKKEIIEILEYNFRNYIRRLGGTATLWLDENCEYKTNIIY